MFITASTISRPVRRHRPFTRRVFTWLPAWIAALVTAAGFASSSCASPRFPIGGYPLRSYAAGYELQVLVDGAPAATYEHAGESYVLGQLGARYTLRVINHTGRRIEAVVSVDGRDAVDGKSADVRTKRGYLVPGWGSVDIDGWRLSRAEVAAFRFSRVADSYAARTGTARDVGVIGVAVFPEQVRLPPRPLYTPPSYPPNMPWRQRPDDGRDESDRPRTMSPSPAPKQSYSRELDRDMGGDAPSSASAPPVASGAEGMSRSEASPAPRSRPGLGTEFGEAVSSPVREVGFARANPVRPSVILGARYNDRDGLLALGINLDGCCVEGDDLAWRQSATPFPVSDRRYATPPPRWQQGCCLGY
jgi:hypothetical protein